MFARIASARSYVLRVTLGIACAGLAVTACGSNGGDGRNAGVLASPVSATASSSAAGAASSPVVLAAGQVGTRIQVPWDQVGPGWFLVLSDSSATWVEPESAPPSPNGTVTMSLVSPAGARYVITSWQAAGSDPRNLAELVAWSGDGRHALFSDRGQSATEMDLTTGVLHQITVPHLITIGFTSPAGANLVADQDISTADGTSLGEQLVRLDLDGNLQVQLAQVYRASARWLYSPDGATVYVNGPGGLLAVSNGGGPVRDLATFETPDADCGPVAWWDQHTILANCIEPGGSRLWLVPVAGGAATPLTGLPGSDSVGLGYDNAIRVGGTVFAEHQEGCGVVTVHRLAPSGVGTRIAIPQSLSNDQLIGAVGTRLAILSSTECGSPSWFGFYDPATNTVQKIVPDVPGELGAGVALAFP